MAFGPRVLELQQALNSYGEASVRNYRLLHKFGEEVVYGLAAYLGEGARVHGVPPEGEWRPEAGDYHDAKFSTYHRGLIVIEPILMGVGLRIPHSKDSGGFWMRVVVEMELVREVIAVQIHDGKGVGGISIDYTAQDVERVQEAIFECAREVLTNPVRSVRGANRIGFIDENT